MAADVVMSADLPLRLFSRGKVRDTYDLGEQLLMVATDRLSAFDCIMPNGIPDKGSVLTKLAATSGSTARAIEHHLLATNVADFPAELAGFQVTMLRDRAWSCKKTKSDRLSNASSAATSPAAWVEGYSHGPTVCGIKLPRGLRQSDKLPEPIFTPATKAEVGPRP